MAAAEERTDVSKTANCIECRCLQQTEEAKPYRGGDASPRLETPGWFPELSTEYGTVLVLIHRNFPRFHGNTKREGRRSFEEDCI